MGRKLPRGVSRGLTDHFIISLYPYLVIGVISGTVRSGRVIGLSFQTCGRGVCVSSVCAVCALEQVSYGTVCTAGCAGYT